MCPVGEQYATRRNKRTKEEKKNAPEIYQSKHIRIRKYYICIFLILSLICPSEKEVENNMKNSRLIKLCEWFSIVLR